MKKTPTTLIILDGYGLGQDAPGNAVLAARTPFLDRCFAADPSCRLSASGLDVGLPEGQIGNSEVGHTNIGAGRVVFQDLPRIHRAIDDGSFFENPAYCGAVDACLNSGGALHLMGLLSDGGVHSHLRHLWALLELCKRKGLSRVYIHAFLDGRDVSPTSGRDFVAECLKQCQGMGAGTLATVMGRFYAMDRDKRWDRVQRAWAALTQGIGEVTGDPVAAVEASYAREVTDEFVEPLICCPDGRIQSGDGIIFFNYRPDRARELTRAFVDPDFDGFAMEERPRLCAYVCTTEYDASMPNVEVAFGKKRLEGILGEHLSRLGKTQLRLAETEKYAHVTFFFNGGEEQVFPGEQRILIPSPKVATYDLQPEMSAFEVAAAAAEQLRTGDFDLVVVNFANCDMVGHTGIYDAAVRAVETVDACVKTVAEATAEMGGVSIITADHGNAEQMLDADGVSPLTAHTLNPVPFLIHGAQVRLRDGRLADIAPTVLEVMGLPQPEEMEGESLILKHITEKGENIQ